MKKKLLNSMRVLLAAAGLCVGANAWATDYTETYNGGTAALTRSTEAITQNGTNGGTVYMLSAAGYKERIALSGSNWQKASSSTHLQAVSNNSSTSYISILDLKQGDIISLSLYIANNYGVGYVVSENMTVQSTGLDVSNGDQIVEAGDGGVRNGTQTYVMKEDGRADFRFYGRNMNITNITIVSQKQSVTRPTITKAPQLDSKTNITITPGVIRGDATGTVVTKYSTSSISNDKSSGTEYTETLEQTTAGTIYAYSYVDADDGLASAVISEDYEVTDFVKTKVIDFTTLGHEGLADGPDGTWNTTLDDGKKSYPTWTVYNTSFIPELTFGSSKIQMVSNYSYIGLRQAASSTITIDDLASNQAAKLINWNETNEILHYGSAGKAMTISNWFVSRRLEYYTPSTTTVTLSVGDAGLATYMGSYTINLTGDTKIAAYRATVNGSTVTLTKVTTVPAGEAVLLRSLVGGAAETTVPVAAYGAWAAADNELVGAYKAITVNQVDGDYTNFVLSKEGDVVGFFKAKTEEDGGTTVGAGKAYLPVLTSGLSASRSMKVVFDDETTAIETIQTLKTTADGYYDLQGRRVTQPTKGLYIVNGKKVVIK